MKFGVVVNTCSMKNMADTSRSEFGLPYSLRVDFLKQIILPALANEPRICHVAVAGDFEPGESYSYVPISGIYHNCRDALAQRQAGYEKVRRFNPDVFLFLTDDHCPSPDFFKQVEEDAQNIQWDVLTPLRRAHSTGEVLNSGWNNVGTIDTPDIYAHTHGIILTKDTMIKCPWSGLTPLYRFDLLHTMWFHDKKLMLRAPSHIFLDALEE